MSLRDIFKFLGVFTAYAVTAYGGLKLGAVSGFAALVWPPTGIALAALLIWGYRLWPAVFLAATLVNYITGAPVLVALAIGAGNSLEPLIGTYLLKRFGFDSKLQRLKDVFGLVIFAAVLATLISATIGVSVLWLAKIVPSTKYLITWFSWWIGDILGALVIAPFILVWLGGWKAVFQKRSLLEVFGWALVLAFFIGIIFGNFFPTFITLSRLSLLYLIFMPIIGITLRFNQVGVTSAMMITSAAAVTVTAIGTGPFSTKLLLTEELLYVQLFLAVVAIVSMILAATSAENKESVKRSEQYAEEILKVNKSLEKTVSQRTADLKSKVMETQEANTAVLNILEDLEAEKKRIELDEAKDEALLSSIGDGIIAVDLGGVAILINKVAEGMLGFTNDELVGRVFASIVIMEDEQGNLVPPNQRPLAIALDPSTTTTTTTTTRNYFFKRKDGSRFPAAIKVTPVVLDGVVTGAIAVFRDITLEREVDKAKTEFVSLASHQLRTPLSTIRWYTEMILNGDVGKINPRSKKYLDEIYRANVRMIELVNSLLNVSRLELGTISIIPKFINLAEIADIVFDELKPQIKKKHLIVVKEYAKNLPAINADRTLVKIILDNLLSNAVKYTPSNGKICIQLLVDKEIVSIQVSDSGCGIPKDQQNQIFSKLFRADNAKQIDPGGNGLGLYIVKSILEKTGGRIWFESEEGKGAKFYVAIPINGMAENKGLKRLGG